MNAPAHQSATVSAPETDDLLFDAGFLRKLERLEIIAKKLFRGLLRGEHTTARRGRGLEFSDFRRYRPGDDFRHIDWNIYSRLDRLFLKLYAAEEDLTLHVLIDSSASMAFGEPLKFDYARRLAAALGYIGLSNLDRVGLSTFNHRLSASLTPLKAKHQITTLLNFLRNLHCSEQTRFGAPLSEFAARYHNPGLVILISDLFADEAAQLGLEALRQSGHDVIVVQLLSAEELDPTLEGVLNLVDAEDASELKITVDANLRALYQARLAEFLKRFEDYCRQQSIEYLRASTAVPFEDLVLKYLRQGTYLR